MKTYHGIKYSFRPLSYWEDSDPLSAILRNVKGENRRQMIRDYWNEGRLEDLDLKLLVDEVDDDVRGRLGRIHPSFMGGEYLPGYWPGEVEIARINLRSTTSDVISVRARPFSGGVQFRVEDEYQAVFVLPITRSTEPLTLEELIALLDGGDIRGEGLVGGLSLGYNELNVEYSGHEELRHFTRILSDFYPQLQKHYEHVFEEWVAEGIAERAAGDIDGSVS